MIYICDRMGHVDIFTTEIYARADTEFKCEALEKACPNMISLDLPGWKDYADILAFLTCS
ncbi:hypothetical protein AXFE_04020 [Acidithrix ferrooxidans]|uniref:Uncharacterized protein n=1 Tax=Acidithrix ferrooxidans TaxID=1280514 RepID=A0A0D8HL23_9ACTN|nr:hypothetical protein AXFE_04020 [Acidithrix ferrooxidans]CAG4910630.1 unnamed protein product [Acidithrix sp. C25]